MLVLFCGCKYYGVMKNKLIYIIASFAVVSPLFCGSVSAISDEASEENSLFFRAVNAGYKDDESSQNYDFIELAKTAKSSLELALFRIEYYNSSDKLAGEISFEESAILDHDTLVLGFSKSPQYANSSSNYLYTFSSSGLASTAGRLRLIFEDDAIDELCWGKLVCENNLGKFVTAAADNYSFVRCDEECEVAYRAEKYYPEINESAIQIIEPELPSCAGLIINEIYSYYENDVSEQFVEILNNSDEQIILDNCAITYKNKQYPLQGALDSKYYIAVRDIPLAKDPSTSNLIELIDGNGVVDSATYEHGQKKGASNILMDGL
jgi:hypothetical protein